jgi:antitoxin CptB
MRELDELLLGFLSRGYAGLDADGQAAFDALLAYPDAILLELLMGRMTPADKDAAGIVREIRNTAAV